MSRMSLTRWTIPRRVLDLTLCMGFTFLDITLSISTFDDDLI